MGKQQRILTFGNVVMDGLYRIAHLPGHDEKVFADEVAWAPGGPAVHFALQAAKICSRASVLGWVGGDSMGGLLLQSLEVNGVESSLHIILNAQTPTAIIMIDQTGEKAVVLSPPMEASRLPAPDEVAVYGVQAIDHLHTHLFLKPYVDPLLAECKKLGISSSIDIEPSSVKRWGADQVRDTISRTTVVFVNEAALKLLCPSVVDPGQSLQELCALGPDIAICTRGNQGSIICSEQGLTTCPAIEVETVNSLAAGDIYASVFINRYVGGSSVHEAACYATAASAVAISQPGTAVHYPSLPEIEAMLNRHSAQFMNWR